MKMSYRISKKITKIFAALLLCALCFMTTKSMACVFMDYKNVYIFGINLLSNSQYANYFYNSPYAEDACFPGNEKNIEEWQKKYPEIKNLDFFHEFIYKTELQEIQKVYNALNGGANPFPKNDFVTLLLAKKDKEALEYLLFAKKCEGLVTQRFGWENEEKPKDKNEPSIAKALIINGKELLASSQNNYFKQRYAFQLVRLAYYHDSEQTAKLFDEIAASFAINGEKNYIYYRTLLHKGFALKKANNNAEANMIFAEVFANSPDLRCMAFKNLAIYKKNDQYAGIDEAIWNETLAKTTNADLKAALYLLRASSEYGMNAGFLQSSFDNGATAEQLEVMLLRQVKAAETNYFLPNLQQSVQLDSAALTFGDAVTTETATVSRGFFGRIWDSIINFFKNLFGSKNSQNIDYHHNNKQNSQQNHQEILAAQVYPTENPANAITQNLSENADLIALEKTSLAIAEKYKDKASIFYLGAAYLQIMRGKYGLSAENIAQAKKAIANQIANQTSLTEQALYLETLQTVLQAENIDENVENIVAQNSLKLWSNVENLNNGWQKLLLFSELGRKYLRQGELAKAVLAFRYCKQYDVAGMLLDFYFNQSDLENYLTFIKGDANTEIKKLFWRELPKTEAEKTNFVKDLQATRMMREGKFSSALAKFKELDANYWTFDPKEYKYEEFDPKKHAPASSWGAVMEGIREGENFYYTSSFDSECTKIRTNFSKMGSNLALTDTFANKMQFLEKLVDLEAKAQAAKGDEAAKIYIEMANGMYHTPFWLYNGAVWGCGGMLEAMRNSSPTHYPFNINPQFATQFHNRKMHVVKTYCMPYLSVVYSKKAVEAATSKEVRADALFAEGGAWNKSLASHWEDGIKIDKSAFQLLLKDYSGTPQATMASACMVK